MSDERPDPELLLSALKREESKAQGGKLKIFFGMSAGVGKTYSMLEGAQKQKKMGVDVVVGIVYTHRREETACLLEGLEAIPEKQVLYKGTALSELDIDAVLKRKPQLVLIDELAHTNAPGSRHPKRWQDVQEILEAGIDVYTTLNVQHVESRKELVEEITGVPVRETVPDSVLERANSIELIDITPKELLQRLKEGKVYLGPQSEVAARHFFKEDKLTALREIALRMTAEQVDHELHGLLSSIDIKGWKTEERILVAISHSPTAQVLIRAARRIAFKIDCPWIALYVDDGQPLTVEQKETLASNMALARDLRAEVITTKDPDIVAAIERVARQRHISLIILGRSPTPSFFEACAGGTLIDRLSQELSDVDLHIVQQEVKAVKKSTWIGKIFDYSPWIHYLIAAGSVAAATCLNFFLSEHFNFLPLGFIFLLAVLPLGVLTRQGPILFAAFLSIIAWSLLISSPDTSMSGRDYLQFSLFLVISGAVAFLSQHIQCCKILLRSQEDRNQVILDVLKEIARGPTAAAVIESVKQRVGDALEGTVGIVLRSDEKQLNFALSSLKEDEKEQAVATWVFEHGKEAGWSTDTLPSVKALYIPLRGFKETIGVIYYQPAKQKSFSLEDKSLLYIIAQQVGSYLERSMTEEKERKKELIQQIERIQHTILESMMSFKPPIESMHGVTSELKQKAKTGKELETDDVEKIEDSLLDIDRMVENVLTMTRLNSRFFALNKELYEVERLIQESISTARRSLSSHTIQHRTIPSLPPVKCDASMIQMALCNLMINAASFSPSDTVIQLSTSLADSHLKISLQSIESSATSKDFHERSSGNSLGLGLTIVQKVIDLHEGWMEIRDLPDGGIEISLYLPI